MWSRRFFLAACAALAAGSVRAHAGTHDTAWARLLAPGWDPQRFIDELRLEELGDMDPEAQAALAKLHAIWDAAPPNPALDGTAVRLSGFMVPLGPERPHIERFVLVPYFGACVHSPRPPANQMVRVVPLRPIPASERGNSALVATGILRIRPGPTDLGAAAYEMAGARIERPG